MRPFHTPPPALPRAPRSLCGATSSPWFPSRSRWRRGDLARASFRSLNVYLQDDDTLRIVPDRGSGAGYDPGDPWSLTGPSRNGG
jgi:hypothetical protein